jgi:hypothetical protein
VFDLKKVTITCAGPERRRHCVGVLCLWHYQELSADGRGGAGPAQGIRIHRVRDAPVSNGKNTTSLCGTRMFQYRYVTEVLWSRKYFLRLRPRSRRRVFMLKNAFF